MIASIVSLIGWAVLLLAAWAVTFLCLAFMLGKLQQLLQRHDDRVASEARRQIGNEMLADAWWFGEFPDAAAVLRAYATRFRNGERVDASKVREEIRASREGASHG